MGLWSSRNILVAGDTVSVTPVNANFEAIQNILNGNLTADNLADGAVIEDKILNGSVTSDKIAYQTIVNDDINPTANIAGSKLLDNSVNGSKLADGTVGMKQLGTMAVYFASDTYTGISANGNATLHTINLSAQPTETYLVIQGATTMRSQAGNVAWYGSMRVFDGAVQRAIYMAAHPAGQTETRVTVPYFWAQAIAPNTAHTFYIKGYSDNSAALYMAAEGAIGHCQAFLLPR